jgi:hypothetical protein
VDPLVEPTSCNAEDLAQPLDGESIPLGMNEGVLYSDSLAKYAALGSSSQRNTLIEAFCGRRIVECLPRALV